MSRADGRALWLPDVLRDAGLPVEVVPGWEHRGKEPRTWVAQVNHHTASSRRGGNQPSLGIVTNGRPDVPGPLANTLPTRDGRIIVVASGAANHPGVAWIPQRGGIASGVKYWTLGHEIELDGVGEPFPVGGRQWEAVHRMNAAIAVYLGHDVTVDLLDHKAIARPQGRKIDVNPYLLATGRAYTARLITGTPLPPPTEEPLMVTKDDEQKIRSIVTDALRPILDALAGAARKAVAVRDPRDRKVWIITEAGRWHVPSREPLDVLVFTGQVAAYGDKIPVADPKWLDQVPVIDQPDAA